jgi:superfamily II DNA or RNA helicase
MLECLALATLPVTRKELFTTFRAVFQRLRQRFDKADTDDHLSTLLELGLAVKAQDRLQCHGAIREDVAASTLDDIRGIEICKVWSSTRNLESAVETRQNGQASKEECTHKLRLLLYSLDFSEPDNLKLLLPLQEQVPEALPNIALAYQMPESLKALHPNVTWQLIYWGSWTSVMKARDGSVSYRWLSDFVRDFADEDPVLSSLVHLLELFRARKESQALPVPYLRRLLAAAGGDAQAYQALKKGRTREAGPPAHPLQSLLLVGSVMRFGDENDFNFLCSFEVVHREHAITRLAGMIHFQQLPRSTNLLEQLAWQPSWPLGEHLCVAIVAHWLERETELRRLRDRVEAAAKAYQRVGYPLLAEAAQELMRRCDGQSPLPNFLLDIFQPTPEWQRRWRSLQGWAQQQKDRAVGGSERVVWILERQGEWIVEPKLQRIGKNGEWTSGKALRLLAAAQKPPLCCDAQDQAVFRAALAGYVAGDSLQTEDEMAILALAGHPRVFLSENGTLRQVQVQMGRPRMRVSSSKKDGLRVRLEPPLDNPSLVQVHQNSPDRLTVMSLSHEQVDLALALGSDWLTLPDNHEHQLRDLLNTVAAANYQLESDLALTGEVETLEADSLLRLRLSPAGDGLSGDLVVRPFGDWGPAVEPGDGGQVVTAERDGKTFQAVRDLKAESDRLNLAVELYPTLATYPLSIPCPFDCLELLEALRERPENLLQIEWPEGQPFRVVCRSSLKSFQMSATTERDWLELQGTLTVSEGKILSLLQLLNLTSGRRGRFLPLGDGEYLALTQEFRDRLDQLSLLGERVGKKERLRVHPLAATVALPPALLSENAHWSQRRQRLNDSVKLRPSVPAGFQADLRPYQQEGFDWMTRLAHWGAGACLADDMGLGKTIQALAVLLDRAKSGPALVVAPMSVCSNWADEAARFAPGLRVSVLSEHDRQALLAAPEAGQVVVCSYGLLVNELPSLEKVDWHTLVLDEAQLIKNSSTRRFQAATALRANFRLATTGTPIENNLEELWSLFHFLNPGLLGSRASFVVRFARPLAADAESPAPEVLRRLIQPFVLRRTKGEVLKELPAKTEITLSVKLSEAEAALYESLRRQAVAAVEKGSDNKLFTLLTHMTKLRRCCCHPQLVMPEAPFGSAKLERLTQLVDELQANDHRALVFSQFVDHLSLVRQRLEQLGVTYQYLDGSTPAKKRKEAVAAFQAGQGDLFLISLKAGGVGLNLTAADYVIHLDPWWNPAVEDQASDRAHRMGQQRPVTVYRLVANDTIEQKIVALHESKRDLAERLLDGTDQVTRLDADELMTLLQETI